MEPSDWSDETLPSWWSRTRWITVVWLAFLLACLIVVGVVVYAVGIQVVTDNAPPP